VRIGIIRESMIVPKGSMTEVPIVTAASREIKEVLGGRLDATLVESKDPLWTRDPDVEVMRVDYRYALAQLIPLIMPDLCSGWTRKASRSSESSRTRSSRPSSCRARSSAGARCSRSTTASRLQKGGSSLPSI
jgi:hypothetical protein